ncbi:hypothetical protein NQ318_015496, partial [Aromia moschata]
MGDEQNLTNSDVVKLLNRIVCQNDEIKNDIATIKKDLSVQMLKIDNLNIKIVALEQEKSELKKKLSAIERKSKRNNFIIFGVDEDVIEILSFILNIITEKLNTSIVNQDINNIYRVGQRGVQKSRPILLELVSNLKKQEIVKQLYKLKGTGIFFSNDLLPQDREENKVLHHQLKLAKEKQYNAKIIKNKLIVNGESYSYQELTNKNKHDDDYNKQNTNHSASATPITGSGFTYNTQLRKTISNESEETERITEKEVTDNSNNSTSTSGLSESS